MENQMLSESLLQRLKLFEQEVGLEVAKASGVHNVLVWSCSCKALVTNVRENMYEETEGLYDYLEYHLRLLRLCVRFRGVYNKEYKDLLAQFDTYKKKVTYSEECKFLERS